MANITPETTAIAEAVYGEEVRKSIIDALVKMNADVNSVLNTLAFKGDLKETDDLNTIDPGIYRILPSKQPANMPENDAYSTQQRLLIYYRSTGGRQELYTLLTGEKYVMSYYVRGMSGGTWGSWFKNIDNTLTADGVAADAKAVGDKLTNLKADLNTEVNAVANGYLTFYEFAEYINGYNDHGTIKPAYIYRVASSKTLTFDFDVEIIIKDGYRLDIIVYDDSDNYVSTYGVWYTDEIVVSANTHFRINIAKVTEDNIQADIHEFSKAIMFKTKTQHETEINDAIDLVGCKKLGITRRHYYIATSGETADPTKFVYGHQYFCIVASCSGGELFTINADGGSGPRAWAFIDDSNNVISKSDSTVSVRNLVVEAPTNASKIIINSQNDFVSYRGKTVPIKFEEIDSRLEELESYSDSRIDSVESHADNIESMLAYETGYRPIPVSYTDKYIDTSGQTVNLNKQIVFPGYKCYIVECSEGDVFTINALGGSAPKAWAFADSERNIINKTYTADVRDYIAVAPENSAYLIINDMDNRTSLYGKTIIANVIDETTGTDYMQKAIKRITKSLKEKSPLGNILVFGFSTDQHIRDYDNNRVTAPVLRGMQVLSKLTHEYPYDFICLGGDACEAGSYAVTPELILDECLTIQKPLYDACCPVIPITGNHDAAQNNNTITGEMLFNVDFKRVVNTRFITCLDNSHTNGYWDSEIHKIRCIFIDSTLRADYIESERSAALRSMLESTPENYNIIIFSHHALCDQLEGEWGTNIAYQTILGAYRDRIICCVAGHCHRDLCSTYDGILYISTTLACCANDMDGNSRTINTENETSFDTYVIDQNNKMIYAFRYGFGNNRIFNYDNTSQTFGEITS